MLYVTFVCYLRIYVFITLGKLMFHKSCILAFRNSLSVLLPCSQDNFLTYFSLYIFFHVEIASKQGCLLEIVLHSIAE